MDWIGWIGGAVCGVTAQYLFDRFRNVSDDYELWCDLTYSSLKSEGEASLGRKLGYSVDGVEIEDPGTLDLYVWCAGKKDVPAASFDRGQDLRIDLGAKIVGVLETKTSADSESVETDLQLDAGELRIKPSLLRKRFALRYRLLLDGKPELETFNPIADLTVRSFYGSWSAPTLGTRIAKWTMRTAFSLFGVGLVGFIAFSAFFRDAALWFADHGGLNWLVGVYMVLATFAITAMLFRTLPNRRAQRAVRILRKSLGEPVLVWERAETSGNSGTPVVRLDTD